MTRRGYREGGVGPIGTWRHSGAADHAEPLANDELRQLYEQDQDDRRTGLPWPETLERDRVRRRRVGELLAAGALGRPWEPAHPEDCYHAAMVLQHGESSDDFLRAHELAGRSVALGARKARWLAAATYDRWLMSQGRPQKYGTQAHRLGHDRPWELWPIDPATTDAERAEWEVKPLAELRPGDSSWLGRQPGPPGPDKA